MPGIRRLRNNRRFAFLIAALFATLSLVASRPHEHQAENQSCPDSLHIAGSLISNPVNCSLCDYHNLAFVTPAAPTTRIQETQFYLVVAASESDSPLCRLSVPHRSLRAPPCHS